MERKSIHYLATLLHKTGITVLLEDDGNFRPWRFIIYIITVSLAMPLMLMLFVGNDENFNTLYPIIATSALILVIGGVLILFYHKGNISVMLYQMDKHIYTYSDEDILDIHYKRYLEEGAIIKLMSNLCYLQYFGFVCLSSPSLLELILFGEVRNYLYPCWTPWSRRDLKLQLVTLAIQMIQSCLATWLNYIVMITFLMTVLEFLRQYERLDKAVSTIKSRSALFMSRCKIQKCKTSSIFSNNTLDLITRRKITECIHHHQLLHRNFNLFKTWFPVMFSLELVICAFSFSLGFYVIFKALSMEQVILYIIAVFIMTANIFSRCFIGEIFLHLNDRVKNTLFFEAQFLEMNSENRRLLVIFHLMLSRPFRLRGFSFFEATHSIFGDIVRKTYSVFNVLNASLNK